MQPVPQAPGVPQAPAAEAHPWSLLLHWLFKVCAVVWFVTCTLFSSNFVVNFVVCVVLVAIDFWLVKNVTGRRLVALRWWNEANDTGSTWRFESAPEGTRTILAREKNLFWLGLISNVAVWALLALLSLVRLNFDYLVIPVVGCLLGCSNLVGYFKCSRDAADQLRNYTSGWMQQGMMQALRV